MDEAGPLKGNMPPILTSVGVTPGLSVAKAADDPTAIANAHPIFHALNIALSSDLPASAAKGCGASLLWAAAATKAHNPRTGVEPTAIHRPQQSTVLFLNSSRVWVVDCHGKPTIVTVWTSTATQSRTR